MDDPIEWLNGSPSASKLSPKWSALCCSVRKTAARKARHVRVHPKFSFRAKCPFLMLHIYKSKEDYWDSRFPSQRCRGHFYYGKKRRSVFGHIHVVEGDMETLFHEIHHAARHAVRLGLVSHKTCSRQTYEERIAVATGKIADAVWREYLACVEKK